MFSKHERITTIQLCTGGIYAIKTILLQGEIQNRFFLFLRHVAFRNTRLFFFFLTHIIFSEITLQTPNDYSHRRGKRKIKLFRFRRRLSSEFSVAQYACVFGTGSNAPFTERAGTRTVSPRCTSPPADERKSASTGKTEIRCTFLYNTRANRIPVDSVIVLQRSWKSHFATIIKWFKIPFSFLRANPNKFVAAQREGGNPL